MFTRATIECVRAHVRVKKYQIWKKIIQKEFYEKIFLVFFSVFQAIFFIPKYV